MPEFYVTLNARAFVTQTQIVEAPDLESAKEHARENAKDNIWQYQGLDGGEAAIFIQASENEP